MCYERIRNDLAEIVEGAARLIERRWPFETAMSDHFARIWALREGRADLIWSIDSHTNRTCPPRPDPARPRELSLLCAGRSPSSPHPSPIVRTLAHRMRTGASYRMPPGS